MEVLELFRKNQKKKIILTAEPKPFPKPYVTTGVGRFFFLNTQEKNICEKQVCSVNLAALSVNNLLPFYLKYVLKNNEDGQYYRTDKEVWRDLALSSEDKAQRVRKLAIERGYLVPGFKRAKLLQVQEDKINEFLKEV